MQEDQGRKGRTFLATKNEGTYRSEKGEEEPCLGPCIRAVYREGEGEWKMRRQPSPRDEKKNFQ